MPDRQRFLIELRDAGGDTPVVIRLRHFLKAALRSWGLRCTDARELTDGQHQADLRRPDVAGGF